MRTRRTVALGLSAVMAVSVLSGCGSSSSSTTADTKGESNASAESSTEPVVLHWWGSFAENMGPEQVCEAFNKIDPNLQVEYTMFSLRTPFPASFGKFHCQTGLLQSSRD